MNKLIFRKLSFDILVFFLIASISITLILWVIQAVNILDIVSEDGHSLKVYFNVTLLSLPKIFSRIIIFIFFISVFYIITKYEENNEILVFWSNGIRKIYFINFILKFSFIFLILQLFLNLLIVPYTQNLARLYLKSSNIDFIPNLISEKKFINVFDNLTIFLEEYEQSTGTLKKIYIKEKLGSDETQIIVAKDGKIIKQDDKFILRLFNGGITNINLKNIYNLNFSETEYDLSRFSTKTVTHPKIQHIKSSILINCLKIHYIDKSINKNNCKRTLIQMFEEMYKRSILPFYILILALISSSLIIKPKKIKYLKFYKFTIFLSGLFIIIFSQISFRLITLNNFSDLFIIIIPLLLIIFFYFYLWSISNFKMNRL